MKYNIEQAQQIIDAKPVHKEHVFIDTDGTPRDRHIENLFHDLFNGDPIDHIFRTNFTVYFQELVADRTAEVKPGIFIDAGTAQRWVTDHIGPVTLDQISDAQRKKLFGDDADMLGLNYRARIKSPHARSVKPAYAPSALHATLLAAVFVFRAEATKRLGKLLASAKIRG